MACCVWKVPCGGVSMRKSEFNDQIDGDVENTIVCHRVKYSYLFASHTLTYDLGVFVHKDRRLGFSSKRAGRDYDT